MKQYRLTPITETAEQVIETEGQKGKIAKQILLGIDAHEHSYQVARKIDACGIQPVQSFKPDKFLDFVVKQQHSQPSIRSTGAGAQGHGSPGPQPDVESGLRQPQRKLVETSGL